MNCRLHPQIKVVENDRGSFLLREIPLAILRVNGTLASLVKRLKENPEGACSKAEEKSLELLAARGFADRLPTPAAGDDALPLVSIIIPVKDRARELTRCLESLERLEYPRELREIIVVDDGSSDASAAVALGFGCRVVTTDAPGSGPAAARNRASVRSVPSTSRASNSGGPTRRPVTATRIGAWAFPSLRPTASATPLVAA